MEKQKVFAIRMYPKDLDKLKELRDQSGLTWPSFIKYVNRIVQADINSKIASELNEFNKEGN